VQISTYDVKAFKSYHLTDRKTDRHNRTNYIPCCCAGGQQQWPRILYQKIQ